MYFHTQVDTGNWADLRHGFIQLRVGGSVTRSADRPHILPLPQDIKQPVRLTHPQDIVKHWAWNRAL